MFPGPLLAASLTFTLFSESADSERVERSDTFESERRRAGICVGASGLTGGVTSWLMLALCADSDSRVAIDANPEPYEDGPAVWGDMEIELSDEGHSALA